LDLEFLASIEENRVMLISLLLFILEELGLLHALDGNFQELVLVFRLLDQGMCKVRESQYQMRSGRRKG
jgi:hypothetical protein